jgi:hypothetical protein
MPVPTTKKPIENTATLSPNNAYIQRDLLSDSTLEIVPAIASILHDQCASNGRPSAAGPDFKRWDYIMNLNTAVLHFGTDPNDLGGDG